jgi:hypothetical protein
MIENNKSGHNTMDKYKEYHPGLDKILMLQKHEVLCIACQEIIDTRIHQDDYIEFEENVFICKSCYEKINKKYASDLRLEDQWGD